MRNHDYCTIIPPLWIVSYPINHSPIWGMGTIGSVSGVDIYTTSTICISNDYSFYIVQATHMTIQKIKDISPFIHRTLSYCLISINSEVKQFIVDRD